MPITTKGCRAPRAGISLIELLVVIAILGVLVAIILPAVQKARLAALRAETAHRFGQVGLATHNFASAHSDSLPNVDGSQPNIGMSVLDALRPYIEADTAVRARPLPDHPDILVAYIPVFVSPSDPSLGSIPDGIGDSSLAANALVFSPNANLRYSISDGLSNTIGYSEHYARCNFTGFSWSLLKSTCQDSSGKVIPCARPIDHRATFADAMYTDAVPTTTGSPPATQGSIPGATFQARPAIKDCDFRIPQATHPNTLVSVAVDGHVQWFRAGVSPQLFWSWVTPRGGERAVEGE